MIWSWSVNESFGLEAGTRATEVVNGLEAGKAHDSRIGFRVVTSFFLTFLV